MKTFRTESELQAGQRLAELFDTCADSTEIKLENFPKYVRRNNLKRFLALYEVFKRVLLIKGSIVECGVHRGFGLMSWAKLSTMLEPENFTRRVYGFDTFEGFPEIASEDENRVADLTQGGLAADSYEELTRLIEVYDKDRFLGHMNKVRLIKGDAAETIPTFLRENRHLVVSLLFLDFDLYEPTRLALEAFLPRMPKGAIVAFDELDNPQWPGETVAWVETFAEKKLRIQRMAWDPYIGFAEIE